jgi:hypothetical protein
VTVAFRELCPRLGRIHRMHIDVGRPAKKEPGLISVRWPCGCLGTGAALDRLALEPCRTHARATETASARS